METMTTEEYYKEINNRNTQLKNARKSTGERIGSQSVENYFAKLNAANRTGPEE